jgi:hypothetical protein
MYSICISADEWEKVGEIDRVHFNNFLRQIIAPKYESADHLGEVVVSLPVTATRLQRYALHRLTTSGFIPTSRDLDGGRVMEIFISKKYVNEICAGWEFKKIEDPEPVSEKQIIFQNLINFIHQNFEKELQNYINNI